MSTIQYMRDIIATLPDGGIKKALIWAELELGERADQIFELENEVKAGIAAEEALREALGKLKAAMEGAAKFAHGAAFTLSGEIFDKDFAPHINLMNRLGDPDYGKPGLPRPHIDTRDVTPRKKKATSA